MFYIKSSLYRRQVWKHSYWKHPDNIHLWEWVRGNLTKCYCRVFTMPSTSRTVQYVRQGYIDYILIFYNFKDKVKSPIKTNPQWEIQKNIIAWCEVTLYLTLLCVATSDGQAEWSSLIGPNLSRCLVLSSDLWTPRYTCINLYTITTHLKLSKLSTFGGILCFLVCCYGKIGASILHPRKESITGALLS